MSWTLGILDVMKTTQFSDLLAQARIWIGIHNGHIGYNNTIGCRKLA
jgi:hypothetical protein